jgi:ElaB/YqjD/DUF883 family membrane-anchored ribosome-binding protein
VKYHGRTIEPEEGAIRTVEVKKRVGGVNAKEDRMDNEGKTTAEKTGDPLMQMRREMAETRERMSGTLEAIESRVSERTDAVKEKLDVSTLVKEHPWPALAAAVLAGMALSATRADAKAAGATAQAAQRASSAAADSLQHLGEAAASRLHGADGDEERDDGRRGIVQRAKASAARVVRTQTRELEHDMRRAAEDIGRSV